MTCGTDWPKQLPAATRDSKRREEVQGYRFSDVAAGPPISELYTRDTPTFWDVEFTFNQQQANTFMLWLKLNDMRYNPKEFEMPIQMEEGVTTQKVRFLAYPQGTQTGSIWRYQARIVARSTKSAYDKCPEGAAYIWQYKSCHQSYSTAATCFGEAFDKFWPKA